MRVILAALDEPLLRAWKFNCSDFACVEIHHGSILDLQVDAVVSPANSFGFMDGGIDALYARRFPLAARAVHDMATDRMPRGILVGQAIIVGTGDAHIPNLIAAPTMRVPMVLPRDTVNPYLAANAALGLARAHKLNSIAFPGMGTGVGKVPPGICGKQFAQAIRDFLNPPEFPVSWWQASERHQRLYSNEVRDLQDG